MNFRDIIKSMSLTYLLPSARSDYSTKCTKQLLENVSKQPA